MTSEIRANTLKNRVGLGTVSFTNTGPVVSGIVTIANSTAEGVRLEDNAGVGGSLKITTPSGYVSIGAGNATFVHLQTDRGSFYFQKRIIVDEGIIASYDENLTLQSPINTNRVTINKDTGLVSILNDLDVDGHTNLDNVSVAGVSTFTGNADFSAGIDVTGNAGVSGNISVGGVISIPDTIQHVNDTNTKIRFPAVDTVSVETAGSERLRITSAGVVDVTGSIIVDDPGGGTGLSMNGVSGQTCGVVRQRDDMQHAIIFRGSSNADGSTITGGNTMEYREYGDHVFKTGAINQHERLRITSGGQVNIGGDYTQTSRFVNINGGSTIGQLQLKGTEADLWLHSTGPNGQWRILGSSGQNTHCFRIYDQTNTAERLRITSTGRVGINESTVDTQLHVSGSANAQTTAGAGTNTAIRITDTDTSAQSGQIYGEIQFETRDVTSPGVAAYISAQGNSSGSAALNFGTGSGGSASTKMTIHQTGNASLGYQYTVPNEYSNQTTFTINGNTYGRLDLEVAGTLKGSLWANSGGLGLDAGGNEIEFYAGSAERVRIDSSGNLLLSKGTQNTLMSYTSDGSDNQSVFVGGGGGPSDTRGAYIWAKGNEYTTTGGYLQLNAGNVGSAPITFSTGGNERLRITNTGQLLLGETSAFDSNVAMQFRKDNAGSQSRFIFRNRGNNGSSRVRLIMSTLNRAANADQFSGMEKYQSGGMAIFNGETDNSYAGMNFFSGNWESMRFRNGNVSGDVVEIFSKWGTSNGLRMSVGGPQSGTATMIHFLTSHYGGIRGSITTNLGGTAYNTSSDYRMKQDVVDMTGAIDRVKLFLPKRFKWKEDPTYTVDGFLAHEASTVVPESVVGEKDAVDSNGDPEYQVMDNSKLVPVLTAALKEAIAKIEILETKVAALEG